MKIKSFGCSFIFGSDLEYTHKFSFEGFEPGRVSWPFLVADHYGLEYETHARPAIGNLRILEKILEQAYGDDSEAFFIINWTWLDRYDFVNVLTEEWTTLLPGQDSSLHNVYYKNFYSQYNTMLTNASYIHTAITALQHKKIPFCMTLMDTTLFDPIDPDWHDPQALRLLQKMIRPHITWFDQQDFLTWSKTNGFAISQNWHPLEQAHQAAADYMIKIFDTQKIIVPAQQVHV